MNKVALKAFNQRLKKSFSTNYKFNDNDSFKLGKPKWSLKELRVMTESNNPVINEQVVDYLANLAKIDLKFAKASKNEIIDDVNIILNCATIIKVNY